MESIIIPRRVRQSAAVSSAACEAVMELLSDFTRAQLLKTKLVTSNFKHRFRMRDGDHALTKALVRLAEILRRNLIRQSPYMTHALTSGTLLLAPTRTSLHCKMYTESSVESIARYLRYLNYLACKNGVPVKVGFTSTPVQEGTDIDIVLITYARLPSLDSGILSHDSYESWLAAVQQNAVEAGHGPDSVFTNTELWQDVAYSSCLGGPAAHNSDVLARCAEIASPERLFIYLPQLLKAVCTLSRKFTYATSAYQLTAD